MKSITSLFAILFFCSCQTSPPSQATDLPEDQQESRMSIQEVPELHSYLDSLQVHGATVVLNLQTGEYTGLNPKRWEQGYLPASTFKIPNSLIGLETGVVSGPDMLFPWNGEKRNMKIWEKDLVFKEAFHLSCVPCYQQIARGIGPDRMNEYLAKFEYGNMDVGPENIDLFWLTGNSRITQLQQLEFLQKLYEETLPLSANTLKTFKEMMVRKETETYRLSGKTGWSIRDGNNVGWFVGFVEKGDEVYIFATNIEPNDHEHTKGFPQARVLVTEELLRRMEII